MSEVDHEKIMADFDKLNLDLDNTIKKLGRSKGSFAIDTIGHRLSKLEKDHEFLLPYGQYNSSNIYTQIQRYEKDNPDCKFEVKICVGFEIGLESLPFKFVKVKRI